MNNKTCLYCHSSFEAHSCKSAFCSQSCNYRYRMLKMRIVNLYAYSDSKKYSDEILKLMKEGSSYCFKHEGYD